MTAFRFEASTHSYWLGADRLPAISTILRSGEPPQVWFTAEHLARGTAVHAATLAFDLGSSSVQFLTAALPEAWRGYFAAYVAFRTTVTCRWTQLEQPRVHRVHRFAGTPDRLGTINRRPALLEIKTGYAAEWHATQTAAQDVLTSPRYGARLRFAVYLRKDGTYRVTRHDRAVDYLNFFAALGRYQRATTLPPDIPADEGRD